MLLDTSGLLCYFDMSDGRHRNAVELSRRTRCGRLNGQVECEIDERAAGLHGL